ncbi:MAG: ligase-associated DNA damage response endonuclease PdeM [Gammaproteobacteria bacterium]|nr:ligase-associated DNA damage response endonuclease PdeM [Gammaproteobacteria bacterium]MBU0848107.1 ligase-associated DNA damage response endonuclease PdeM [Gammaproteobacteria bacterium]MBU1267646.1 ligase-associated DNA damage response endonuclease PdeM [Gammaproteobacteria bacterium]MBU1530007.1 ligase-associated DNA damage response endonuclease PdeM [Gammaproteobacteria bacterium]MBU1779856.1 ligase-associated DNA damage response endonuclease PdeM [Gammaproteobacteria bacterium]
MILLSSHSPVYTVDTSFGPLVLSCHKVVFDPVHRALFVADVHLGKAATFRSLGVPVPAGTTQENLDRLSVAIAAFQPGSLYFLGDLLHAKAAHNPDLLSKLHAWRMQHADIAMTLIKGNHDSKAGDPPENLNISIVAEPFRLGGFALCHHPQNVPAAFALAGHEHPVVVLNGKGRSRARLPCFYLKANQLILPSFGEFTGGYEVIPKTGELVFPVV